MITKRAKRITITLRHEDGLALYSEAERRGLSMNLLVLQWIQPRLERAKKRLKSER